MECVHQVLMSRATRPAAPLNVIVGTGLKVPRSVFVNSTKLGLEFQRFVKVLECDATKINFMIKCVLLAVSRVKRILGDPGADSGGEGKSKHAGKYGTREK